MNIKVVNGKLETNRCMYKDIKRYDRATMDSFLQEIYLQGVRAGVKQGATKRYEPIPLKTLERALIEIKGVGLVKAFQIAEAIYPVILKGGDADDKE